MAVSRDREPVQSSCSTSLFLFFSTGNTEGRIQVTIVQDREKSQNISLKRQHRNFTDFFFFLMLKKNKTDHLSSSTKSLIYDDSLHKKTQLNSNSNS